MALVLRQTNAGETWVARPNWVQAPVLARRLALIAAALSLSTALAFTAFGAWPVLPFAGLEVAALWGVLTYLQRHAGDEERIEITDDAITIVRSLAGRCERFEFPRYWAQLRLHRAPFASAPTCSPDLRLFIRSHGRELEIGRVLTLSQKQVLADELKNRLGPTPAPGSGGNPTPTEEET